ncbi:phosphoadenosine phosphosulfate reductase family protein [Cupriavidus alkaliphilus]|uniref:phosphoadenosine phosphosulfate reductase domain-containing protein n=1 Tax=Cupriavidus alkaliphilus TaxID=942866 RepID=UPI00182025F7|nr:phosphoadenosine phosphosulfate reductase family protein [Cupriavidus alkaliphilus]MBB3012039.1 3'-phosphoadenosine 5'-phosphosulfate sulfotransferase (PAPS reductase)/FAD synthetase [Cupriavidus alkaliphilus]
MRVQTSIFDGGQRLQMIESIELTVQSMQAYGPTHDHWGIAWSGGKDSSATLTMIIWLIDTGRIIAPKTLTIFYADTRQELPPLAIAADQIMDELRERGIRVEIVRAPLDKRFMVYILGRGVPPPNNNTLRWCTRQIKIDPMEQALRERLDQLDSQILMITGVRQGESAIRDLRIEMSCSKDGAECGQG